MILETERLFLREMRQNDFRDLAEILQNPNEMIGQAGLTIQPYKNAEVLEIGYLLKERFWHCGYAREAVNGCKKYAFEYLNKDKVYSIIKADNLASIKVAESVSEPATRTLCTASVQVRSCSCSWRFSCY